MICTGYFSKTISYTEAGMIPISIARVTPAFFKGKEWKIFAPPSTILKLYKSNQINQEEYTKMYIDYLEKHITEEMLSKLKKIFYKGPDIVLLCYEKPEDFCHRHILGNWLAKKAMLLVSEVHIVTIRKKVSL